MTPVSEVTEPESAEAAPAGGQSDLTIDELAQRTGMTVRNIRAHQSRALLPPPEVRGRTGFYGPDHVARIELIQDLQADGFNLESIRRLIESAGGSSGEVLRFTQAVRAPFEDEEPEILDLSELADRFGEAARPELLERTLRLGLIRDLGDGRYEQRSPRLARAADELAALGVAPERGLEVAARLRRHAEGAARAFVDLFLEEVWKPFEAAGRPEERWPEVREALERLRPLAADSLLAMFQLVMTDRVEKTWGRELERAAANPQRKRAPAARAGARRRSRHPRRGGSAGRGPRAG
jgi:DNA-binding transcriptional MerR regulator